MTMPFPNTLLPKNPVSKILEGFGIAATFASVLGSYAYLLNETNSVLLAGTAAAGMGAIMAASLHVAFNFKGWQKRTGYALVAIAISAVNSYTIYQQNSLSVLKVAEQRQELNTQSALADFNARQATLEQSQKDARAEKESLRVTTAADREAQKLLKDTLDKCAKLLLQKNFKPKPGACDADLQQNNQSIYDQKEIDIAEREKLITAQDVKLEKATTALLGLVRPAGAAGASGEVVVPLDVPRLLRSALYDALAFLFLALAAAYRKEKEGAEVAQANQLQTVLEQVQEQVAAVMQAKTDLADSISNSEKIREQAKTVACLLRAAQKTNEQIAASELSGTRVVDSLREVQSQLMSQSEGTKTALTSTEAKTQKLIELLGASEKLEAGLTSVGRTAVQTLGAITRSLETADQKQSALESASDQAGVKAVKLESLASALAAQVEQTQALINGLDSSTEDAHTCKSAIDNAVIAASKAIAHAKTLNAHALSAPNAHAIDVVSSQGELAISPLTDEEAITLLRAQGIGVTDEGFLSNESIQAATGWGRPKAVKLKDVGYELGILGRKQHGKGWVYFYLKAENTETPEIPCSLEVSSIPENPENPINSSVIVGNFNRKHS